MEAKRSILPTPRSKWVLIWDWMTLSSAQSLLAGNAGLESSDSGVVMLVGPIISIYGQNLNPLVIGPTNPLAQTIGGGRSRLVIGFR